MYLSFFGLTGSPFDTSPQSDAVFETPQHNEALASLIYGVGEHRGFVAVTGEVGVGKTTILKSAVRYLRQTSPNLILIDFASPLVSPEELLREIVRKTELFDPEVSVGTLEPLRAHLLSLRTIDRRAILIFDEAQSIPAPTLEFLRILSNLDGQGRPLLVIVFSGQPEFEARMAQPENRALNQRIAIRARIPQLTTKLAKEYVQFRLKSVGGIPEKIMAPAAIDALVRIAGTNPRRLNILADNALVAGFGNERKPIGKAEVLSARGSLGNTEKRPRSKSRMAEIPWRLVSATVIGVALIASFTFAGIYLGLPFLKSYKASVRRTEVAATVPPQIPAAQSPALKPPPARACGSIDGLCTSPDRSGSFAARGSSRNPSRGTGCAHTADARCKVASVTARNTGSVLIAVAAGHACTRISTNRADGDLYAHVGSYGTT